MFSFPNDYQLYARTHCTGEPQIDKIVRLLALLQEAFGLLDWGDDRPTITRDFVSAQLAKAARRRRPDLNTPLGVTIASANVDVRIMIDTGALPLTPTDADAYNILFNGDFKKPDPKYWLQVIGLLRPYKVRLAHCENGFVVEPQERIHRYGPLKPAACFGLDYYTEPVLTNLGGKAHVLATPAHRTSEFLDGVLIELVPGFYLDPANPEHLDIQRRAMHHLGIDD